MSSRTVRSEYRLLLVGHEDDLLTMRRTTSEADASDGDSTRSEHVSEGVPSPLRVVSDIEPPPEVKTPAPRPARKAGRPRKSAPPIIPASHGKFFSLH
jgi:hypothetical protein